MYGKSFASMYSGSMFGKPPLIFAVWGYVITFQRQARDGQCYVELNPLLLAPTFSTSVEEVIKAIELLCSPDPVSRSPDEDGRRLIPVDSVVPGPAQYRVVNGAHYRGLRDDEERREYLRLAKRKERERKKSTPVNNVNRRPPRSTQSDAETDSESDADSDARERARARAGERLRWTIILQTLRAVHGGQERYDPSPGSKHREALEWIAAKPDDEWQRVIEHYAADPWVKANPGRAHPAHVQSCWDKYVDGPMKTTNGKSGPASATPFDEFEAQPLGGFDG